MARRGNSPVLYELLGSATASPGQASSGPHAAESSSAAPRRSIRVPIGWIWLAAVASIALMAIAYQFGRSSGDRAGFARGQELVNDRAAIARMSRETPDPIRRFGAGAPEADIAAQDRALDGTGAAAPVARFQGDPRVRGRNYLVIARPAAEEAEKLVAFLSSHGLEVAAVPDDNARFRKVVALPGFPGGTGRSSEQVRLLENRVKALGQIWKAAARGNRDFNDAYLELHR